MGNANSQVKDRAVGAIIGGLIADAAAVHTHWIYDPSRLDGILKDEGRTHSNPEFIEKSYNDFYNIPSGAASCYGDQLLALLKSLVSAKGFDETVYKKAFFDIFGPESAYHKYGYEGCPKDKLPGDAPWRMGTVKNFLAKYNAGEAKTGADDSMSDSYVRTAPLAVLYAGKAELPKMVEQMVRVTQDNDMAVKWSQAAAILLEEVILNGGSSESFNKCKSKMDADVAKQLDEAIARKGDDHRQIVQEFGPSCSLPGNMKIVMQGIAKTNGVYLDAVRQTMVGGGDNCGRCMFTGAVLGASMGMSGLPKDWVNKLGNSKELISLSEQLAGMRF